MTKRTDIESLSKDDLVEKVMNLQHQVALLQKMMFGPTSGRFKVAEAPRQSALQADETGMKVLENEKGDGSHQGYLWAYRDVLRNIVLFECQKGRNKEGPERFLKDFKGYLQTDGYAAYDQCNKKADVTTLCCMVHARRYFSEAESNEKQRATHALLAFQKIYDQERQMKVLSVAERQKLRRDDVTPLMEALFQWMKEEYPKSNAELSDRQGAGVLPEAREGVDPAPLRRRPGNR